MELETFEALYRYFPPDERKCFMDLGFKILQDCFRIKGFRKSTRWHNIANRQMLAQFFTTNPKAYRKIISERSYADFLKLEKDFPRKCHLWSDYYHQKFGAPEFTSDEAKTDFNTAIVTNAFDAWFKDYAAHHEIGEEIRKYYPAMLFWVRVHNILSQANTLTFDEICERVWKRAEHSTCVYRGLLTLRRLSLCRSRSRTNLRPGTIRHRLPKQHRRPLKQRSPKVTRPRPKTPMNLQRTRNRVLWKR